MEDNNKFKVGDRVTDDEGENTGTVIEIKGEFCVIKFDDGEETVIYHELVYPAFE